MPIVSSTAVASTPLPDGSRLVTETHIDSGGMAHEINWFGTAATNAFLTAHAAELGEQLAEAEADALLGGG